MQRHLERIYSFLIHNPSWMYFAGILFTAITLVLNEGTQTWSNYLFYIGRLSFLFSPVLVYGLLRRWLHQHSPPVFLAPIVAFLFLGYPYLIDTLHWYPSLVRPELDQVAIKIVSFWFLVTEVALYLNSILSKKMSLPKWLSQLHLEQGVLLFIGFFAIFYISIGFLNPGNSALRNAGSFIFISYTIQVFIILLIYYSFYLIHHYVLVDQLWKHKGIVHYLFGFAATIIFLYPIAAQLIAWLPMVRAIDIHPVNDGLIFEDINFLVPLFGMLMSIPFIITVKWIRQQRRMNNLAKEKADQELNLLKQQINPHFFFNTLNNLYALSITKDEQTPEVVMQLAELMRYVIYKGKEEHVTITEEVQYIEDYIRLQQIRIHQKLDFRFDKEIADEQLHIPPLLFITLVENAFKHGIEPAEEACFLHMRLEANSERLFFRCSNSVPSSSELSSGIGIANLKRRLAIRYPSRHLLDIQQRDGTFEVVLSIEFG